MATTDLSGIRDFETLRRCRKEIEAEVASKREKVLSDLGEVRERLTPFNIALGLFRNAASAFGASGLILPLIRLFMRKFRSGR